MKLLAAMLVHDTEVVERFEREARMTAKLDHPNIVPVYDVGRHHGRPFIVMKKLEGTTLATLLREKGGLTADETLRLLKQLSAGLDFIHAKGFIHRDIKAGNIFVGSDGLGTLLDFGILRSSNASESLTKAGVVMGTPHYMAPEQAIGSKEVDHRVDLYALAVVLFECLTGTLPFEADSELRLIQMQAHAPPPDLLERAPWIPKPVAEVVKRALAKRPQDRYASAAEIVKALEQAYAQARTVSLPQAQALVDPLGTAPANYKGPPTAPGTAPSWRNRADSAPEIPELKAFEPSPAPGAPAPPVVPTPPVPVPPTRPSRVPLVGAVIVIALAGTAVALHPWDRPTVVDVIADAGAQRVEVALAVPDASIEETPTPDAGSGQLAVEPRAPDAGAKTVAVYVPPKRGSVNVISTHDGEMFWSQVFVDGIDKGRTPLTLDLMPGRYQLRVERHGFRTQERQILIASGKSIVVRIDLAP